MWSRKQKLSLLPLLLRKKRCYYRLDKCIHQPQVIIDCATNIKTDDIEAGINWYVKLLVLCVDVKQMFVVMLPAFYMNLTTSVSCLL